MKNNSLNAEVVSKKKLYTGYLKAVECDIIHDTFEKNTMQIQREVIHQSDAITVCICDFKARQLVLAKQFRVGPFLSDSYQKSPWIYETVAGVIEANDSHANTVFREVKEEVGIDLEKITLLYDYLSSPGTTSQKIYLYLGVCDLTQVTEQDVFGLNDEGEDIKRVIFSFEEALKKFKIGQFDNAFTTIAIQWLELFLLKEKTNAIDLNDFKWIYPSV